MILEQIPDGWRCHICGDMRPDEQIGVFSREVEIKGGVKVTMNVRYCKDRPNCVEKSKTFSFFKGIGAE